jgi:GNAT superfamily N-acetyltransferase
MKDGETVAYNWIIPDYWDIYAWIRVRLATGEWYAAGTHVVRAYRGQRLQGKLRKFAWSQLANEGHTRAVTFVERLNRSSLRSQVKPARRYVGRLTFLRI